jgi:hypothetical protein
MGNLLSDLSCARKSEAPETLKVTKLTIEKPPSPIPQNTTLQTAVGLRPIGYEKTYVITTTQEEGRRKFGM